MIYLFNKVHLKPDALYYKRYDRIVATGSVVKVDELQPLADEIFGKVHFHSASLGELVNTHFASDEHAFIKWLVEFDSSKRLEVHLSRDDLFHITSRWYKTILPHMSSDFAFTLLHVTYARAAAVYGILGHPQTHMQSRDAAVFADVPPVVNDKDAFIAYWDSVEPYDVSRITTAEFIASQSPIEFQLASLYADPDYFGAADLKAKVTRMVKKFHIRMAVDMKHMTLQRLSVLPGFDVQTMTVEDWVKDYPEYKLLDDDQFLPDFLDQIEATYDYADIKAAYVAQMKKFEYQNVDAIIAGTHMFDPSITFDDIMQFELAHTFGRQQLGWWEYHNFINTYVVDLVLNAVRSNDTATLMELRLLQP